MTVTFMLSSYYFFTLYDVLQKRSNVLQKLGHSPANMVSEVGKSGHAVCAILVFYDQWRFQ